MPYRDKSPSSALVLQSHKLFLQAGVSDECSIKSMLHTKEGHTQEVEDVMLGGRVSTTINKNSSSMSASLLVYNSWDDDEEEK